MQHIITACVIRMWPVEINHVITCQHFMTSHSREIKLVCSVLYDDDVTDNCQIGAIEGALLPENVISIVWNFVSSWAMFGR